MERTETEQISGDTAPPHGDDITFVVRNPKRYVDFALGLAGVRRPITVLHTNVQKLAGKACAVVACPPDAGSPVLGLMEAPDRPVVLFMRLFEQDISCDCVRYHRCPIIYVTERRPRCCYYSVPVQRAAQNSPATPPPDIIYDARR